MAENLFTQKVHYIRPRLRADFTLSDQDADAIIGNLAHESGGFEHFQEIDPTVAGSRGGFGWAQWTGPRRRAFEAYCSRNDLDPFSDVANYGWLWVELTGPEKRAIPAVKAAKGLAAKVKAFELNFERAGIKHYDSRTSWAKRSSKVPLTEEKSAVKTEGNGMLQIISKVFGGLFSNGGAGSWLGRIVTMFGVGEAAGVVQVSGMDITGQPLWVLAIMAFFWLRSEKQDFDLAGLLGLLGDDKQASK